MYQKYRIFHIFYQKHIYDAEIQRNLHHINRN